MADDEPIRERPLPQVGRIIEVGKLDPWSRFVLPGDPAAQGAPLRTGIVRRHEAGSTIVEVDRPPKTVRFRGREVTFGGRQQIAWSSRTLVLFQGRVDPTVRAAQDTKAAPENSAPAITSPPRGAGDPPVTYCWCGCGQIVRTLGARFVRGHALPHYKRLRGIILDGEPVIGMPEAVRERWGDPSPGNEQPILEELAEHLRCSVGELLQLREEHIRAAQAEDEIRHRRKSWISWWRAHGSSGEGVRDDR